MRDQVIEYLKRQNLGGLALSTDLPFQDSGMPLYQQNPKTIYVDTAETAVDPIIQTLGARTISNEIPTISVFFTVDAKTVLPSYDQTVQTVRSTRNAIAIPGIARREDTVETEYETDLLITQINIILTRLAK